MRCSDYKSGAGFIKIQCYRAYESKLRGVQLQPCLNPCESEKFSKIKN